MVVSFLCNFPSGKMFCSLTDNFSLPSNTFAIALVTFSIFVTSFSIKFLWPTHCWFLFCKMIKNWKISLTVKTVDRKMIKLLYREFVNFVVWGCSNSANPYLWPRCVVKSIAPFLQNSGTMCFPSGNWNSSTSKQ